MTNKILMELRKAGYKNVSELARNMIDSGHYKGECTPKSLASYLGQIFSGNRSCPDYLLEGVVNACDGDEAVRRTIVATGINRKLDSIDLGVESPLESALVTGMHDLYSRLIALTSVSHENEERLRLLSDFEALVLKYEGNQNEEATLGWDRRKVRQIRSEEGLTGEQLGEQLGLSRQTVSGYENGINPDNLSGNQMKYLEWLRDKGYNPFDIYL